MHTVKHQIGNKSQAARQGVKWTTISTLSAFITVGLGLSMAAMIATEFKAQETLESGVFEINPVEADIVVDVRTTELEPYKKVDTPPPPPVLPRDNMGKVDVPPIIIKGGTVPFDPSVIEIASTTEINLTKDYQPTVRVAPVMPTRATKSGHCQMTYDVSPEGRPFNVRASYCNESHFSRASIKSVQGWKYLPRYIEGRPVSVRDVKTKISFNLTDDRGQIIPE